MAIRIHFGPIYAKRRYDRWNIIPCEDKEPEYWTRMPENMEYRLGVMRTLRWRKRLKYGYWYHGVFGDFRKRSEP